MREHRALIHSSLELLIALSGGEFPIYGVLGAVQGLEARHFKQGFIATHEGLLLLGVTGGGALGSAWYPRSQYILDVKLNVLHQTGSTLIFLVPPQAGAL